MKQILIIVFVLAVPSILLAQNVVSKKVEKTYAVTGNGSLGISGKYGDIHIDTWDESKVEVKVFIEVTKRTEKLAQEMLDNISIGIEDNTKKNIELRNKWKKYAARLELGSLILGHFKSISEKYYFK